jgi:predicted PurR-regulated permease PerM
MPFFTHLIEEPLAWISRWIPISVEQIRDEMMARMQTFAAAALKGAGAVVSAITSSIGHIILAFIILYFFLRDGAILTAKIVDSLPIPRAHTEHLMEIINSTITANLYGVLAVSSAQGLLMTIGFWFSSLPSPVTWGLVTFLCSMIPIVGVALIWIPAAITLFAKGAIWKGIIFVLWSVLVVGLSDNIIRPWLVVGRVKQHPLLVLFSILGGTQAFGLPGLILGPVVVAITIALIKAIRVELYRQSEDAPSPPHAIRSSAPPVV